MKKSYIIIIIGLILAFFIVIFWKIDSGNENNIKSQDSQRYAFPTPYCDTSTTTIDNLKTYVNDRYGYSYKSSEKPTSFGGQDSHFSVRSVLDPDFRSYYGEYNKSMTLKEYVQSSTRLQLEQLEETVFNGRIAYRYQDTLGYKVITEDNKGVMYVIHYDESDCLSNIKFLTLVVDSDLILKKVKPSDWKVVENPDLGVKFSYPSNIFTKEESSNSSALFDLAYLSSKRGVITVAAYNYDTELELTSFEKINLGNKIGYSTYGGEGGGSITVVFVPISNETILRIDFSSDNYDNLYQISLDKVLQKEILSTFIFTSN